MAYTVNTRASGGEIKSYTDAHTGHTAVTVSSGPSVDSTAFVTTNPNTTSTPIEDIDLSLDSTNSYDDMRTLNDVLNEDINPTVSSGTDVTNISSDNSGDTTTVTVSGGDNPNYDTVNQSGDSTGSSINGSDSSATVSSSGSSSSDSEGSGLDGGSEYNLNSTGGGSAGGYSSSGSSPSVDISSSSSSEAEMTTYEAPSDDVSGSSSSGATVSETSSGITSPYVSITDMDFDNITQEDIYLLLFYYGTDDLELLRGRLTQEQYDKFITMLSEYYNTLYSNLDYSLNGDGTEGTMTSTEILSLLEEAYNEMSQLDESQVSDYIANSPILSQCGITSMDDLGFVIEMTSAQIEQYSALLDIVKNNMDSLSEDYLFLLQGYEDYEIPTNFASMPATGGPQFISDLPDEVINSSVEPDGNIVNDGDLIYFTMKNQDGDIVGIDITEDYEMLHNAGFRDADLITIFSGDKTYDELVAEIEAENGERYQDLLAASYLSSYYPSFENIVAYFNEENGTEYSFGDISELRNLISSKQAELQAVYDQISDVDGHEVQCTLDIIEQLQKPLIGDAPNFSDIENRTVAWKYTDELGCEHYVFEDPYNIYDPYDYGDGRTYTQVSYRELYGNTESYRLLRESLSEENRNPLFGEDYTALVWSNTDAQQALLDSLNSQLKPLNNNVELNQRAAELSDELSQLNDLEVYINDAENSIPPIEVHTAEELEQNLDSINQQLDELRAKRNGANEYTAAFKIIGLLQNGTSFETAENTTIAWKYTDTDGTEHIVYNNPLSSVSVSTSSEISTDGIIYGGDGRVYTPVSFKDLYGDTETYNAIRDCLVEEPAGFGETQTVLMWNGSPEQMALLAQITEQNELYSAELEELDSQIEELVALKNQLESMQTNVNEQTDFYANNINYYTRNADFMENCNFIPGSVESTLNSVVTNTRSIDQYNSGPQNHDVTQEELGAIMVAVANGDATLNRNIFNYNGHSVMLMSSDSADFIEQYSQWMPYLNDQEIEVINYIYNTQGGQAVYNYLRDKDSENNVLADQLDSRWLSHKTAEDQAWATDHPYLASLASIVMTPFEGMGAAYYSWRSVINGEEIRRCDVYSAGNVYRGTVSSNIRENYGAGWAFLYDSGMSMADSAALIGVTALTGPVAAPFLSAALMGSRSYVSTLNDALDRGLSDRQAVALATTSAAVETAMETWSVSHLFKLDGFLGNSAIAWAERAGSYFGNPEVATRVFNVAFTSISQALVEGDEELCTELANSLLDTWIAGDNSQWAISKRYYQELGYTDAEIYNHLYGDVAYRCFQAWLGGAFSGLGFGGAAGVRLNIATSSAINSGYFGDMLDSSNNTFGAALVEMNRQQNVAQDMEKLARRLARRQTFSNISSKFKNTTASMALAASLFQSRFLGSQGLMSYSTDFSRLNDEQQSAFVSSGLSVDESLNRILNTKATTDNVESIDTQESSVEQESLVDEQNSAEQEMIHDDEHDDSSDDFIINDLSTAQVHSLLDAGEISIKDLTAEQALEVLVKYSDDFIIGELSTEQVHTLLDSGEISFEDLTGQQALEIVNNSSYDFTFSDLNAEQVVELLKSDNIKFRDALDYITEGVEGGTLTKEDARSFFSNLVGKNVANWALNANISYDLLVNLLEACDAAGLKYSQLSKSLEVMRAAEHYYFEAATLDLETGTGIFETYRTHGIVHVVDVLTESINAYTAMSSAGFKQLDLDTIMLAAVMHDTGMSGGQQLVLSVDDSGKLVIDTMEVQSNGGNYREAHSFNSGVFIIKNAEVLEKADYTKSQIAEAALIAFAHSKSNSGLNPLAGNPEGWSFAIQALQEATQDCNFDLVQELINGGVIANNGVTTLSGKDIEVKCPKVYEVDADGHLLTLDIKGVLTDGNGNYYTLAKDGKTHVPVENIEQHIVHTDEAGNLYVNDRFGNRTYIKDGKPVAIDGAGGKKSGKIETYTISAEVLDRLSYEALAVRIGDALTNNDHGLVNQYYGRITFNGTDYSLQLNSRQVLEAMMKKFEKAVDSKDIANIPTIDSIVEALLKMDDGLQDAAFAEAGDISYEVEGISRDDSQPFVLGENNQIYRVVKRTDGTIDVIITVKNSNHVPFCTLFAIQERAGELLSLSKVDNPLDINLVIEIDADTSTDIRELYQQYVDYYNSNEVVHFELTNKTVSGTDVENILSSFTDPNGYLRVGDLSTEQVHTLLDAGEISIKDLTAEQALEVFSNSTYLEQLGLSNQDSINNILSKFSYEQKAGLMDAIFNKMLQGERLDQSTYDKIFTSSMFSADSEFAGEYLHDWLARNVSDKVADIVSRRYEIARQTTAGNSFMKNLFSFCDHTEAHTLQVAFLTMQSALQINEMVKNDESSASYYAILDEQRLRELFVTGIMHDLGMGNLEDGTYISMILGENGQIGFETKPLSEFIEILEQLEEEAKKNGNVGPISKGKIGDIVRSLHTLNSALDILEMRDELERAGLNPDRMALIAFSHSKSNSGIANLTSVADFSLGVRMIEAATKVRRVDFHFDHGTSQYGTEIGIGHNTYQLVETSEQKGLGYKKGKVYGVDLFDSARRELASSGFALRVGDAYVSKAKIKLETPIKWSYKVGDEVRTYSADFAVLTQTGGYMLYDASTSEIFEGLPDEFRCDNCETVDPYAFIYCEVVDGKLVPCIRENGILKAGDFEKKDGVFIIPENLTEYDGPFMSTMGKASIKLKTVFEDHGRYYRRLEDGSVIEIVTFDTKELDKEFSYVTYYNPETKKGGFVCSPSDNLDYFYSEIPNSPESHWSYRRDGDTYYSYDSVYGERVISAAEYNAAVGVPLKKSTGQFLAGESNVTYTFEYGTFINKSTNKPVNGLISTYKVGNIEEFTENGISKGVKERVGEVGGAHNVQRIVNVEFSDEEFNEHFTLVEDKNGTIFVVPNSGDLYASEYISAIQSLESDYENSESVVDTVQFYLNGYMVSDMASIESLDTIESPTLETPQDIEGSSSEIADADQKLLDPKTVEAASYSDGISDDVMFMLHSYYSDHSTDSSLESSTITDLRETDSPPPKPVTPPKIEYSIRPGFNRRNSNVRGKGMVRRYYSTDFKAGENAPLRTLEETKALVARTYTLTREEQSRFSIMYAWLGSAQMFKGLEFEDMQLLLDQYFKTQVVDKSDVGIRMSTDSLMGCLESGYVKNFFETNTSTAHASQAQRAGVEENLFGISQDTAYADRPVYGLLFPSGNDISRQDRYILDGPGQFYRTDAPQCVIVFNKSAIEECSTCTVGDSLDYEGILGASPLSAPRFKGAHKLDLFLTNDSVENMTLESITGGDCDTYVEVQIHGQQAHQFNSDTVQEVIFYTTPDEQLVAKLEEKGISWRVIGQGTTE